MESKSPCVDCITLGICKAMIPESYGLQFLAERCSIYKQYYGKIYLDSHERKILLDLFKGKVNDGN